MAVGNLTELTAIKVRDGFDDFGLCIHHEWSAHNHRLFNRFAAEHQKEGRDAHAPHSLAGGTRTHLTFSARAHFLKRGGKLYEIPPQSRYSRFAKLRESNGL